MMYPAQDQCLALRDVLLMSDMQISNVMCVYIIVYILM